MSFDPIPLKKKKPRRWLRVLIWLGILGAAALAIYYLVYRIFFPSARWAQYRDFNQNPDNYANITLRPGTQCDGAPFAFPAMKIVRSDLFTQSGACEANVSGSSAAFACLTNLMMKSF